MIMTRYGDDVAAADDPAAEELLPLAQPARTAVVPRRQTPATPLSLLMALPSVAFK
jgi:hypothetical protein